MQMSLPLPVWASQASLSALSVASMLVLLALYSALVTGAAVAANEKAKSSAAMGAVRIKVMGILCKVEEQLAA